MSDGALPSESMKKTERLLYVSIRDGERAATEHVADVLHDALDRFGVGEVFAHETSSGIMISTTRQDDALAVISAELERLGVSRKTDIKQQEPEIAFHRLYGQPSHRRDGTFDPPHRLIRLPLPEVAISRRKGPRKRTRASSPYEIPSGQPSYFLEINLTATAKKSLDRDALEDALEEALTATSLGEVTGAGAGRRGANIDIEVVDRKRGLAVVKKALEHAGAPRNTRIHDYEMHRVYFLYGVRSKALPAD